MPKKYRYRLWYGYKGKLEGDMSKENKNAIYIKEWGKSFQEGWMNGGRLLGTKWEIIKLHRIWRLKRGQSGHGL